jgi:glycosyltransferase involved in cell wall biosynthesis
LYSELADYFLACVRKLVKDYPVEVHVIHWPVNKEAPFAFDFPQGVNFYERNRFPGSDLKKKIDSISPDFIYCSGWMDKDYLAAVKGYKQHIPVVIGLDTWWEGKLKQHIAGLLSLFTIKNIFSHCWVPGLKQKTYALKLGFPEERIMMGYYSADTEHFKNIGERCKEVKKNKYPHRLIYVGRYYEFKGIKDLWTAFSAWKKETNSDWELWCLGTGDIAPVEAQDIKHFGFVQPKDMEQFLIDSGVFVMPSRFEPWGVVLHEFATAGFPIICSDRVGAAEAFIKEGENGYIYPVGDVDKLKDCISKITALSDEKLLQMGDVSRELSEKISPAKWAETLMKTIKTI